MISGILAAILTIILLAFVGTCRKPKGFPPAIKWVTVTIHKSMIFETLATVLTAVILLVYFATTRIKPEGYPPGPLWWPFVGNSSELRHLSKLLGGQHFAIAELNRKYRTNVLGLKLGGNKVVCVSSYPLVKKVLLSDEYGGRPDNFFFRLRTMGTRKGITSTDGPFWREQRSFVMTHMRNLGFGKMKMELMIKEEIREILATIDKNKDDLDLVEELSLAILNVLWTLTSGNRLDSNTRLSKLLQLLKKRSRVFDMAGGLLTQYPWLRYIMPEKTGYNLVKAINTDLKDIIMETINKHRQTWTPGNRDDLIYSFLTEMDLKKDDMESTFTDDQLVMICLDIFLAGADTTSNTISIAFSLMILHPDVQANVQKCLDDTFEQGEDIFYRDKQKVPYIEAVLLEVERFCPVVPISGPRRVLTDTILDGYMISKGSTVLINQHSVLHDPEYWNDPEVFRPERFLDHNRNLITKDQLIPFGLGRRRCPGESLAKSCIFLFLVEILRKFKIEAKLGTKLTGKPVPGIITAAEKYRARFITR